MLCQFQFDSIQQLTVLEGWDLLVFHCPFTGDSGVNCLANQQHQLPIPLRPQTEPQGAKMEPKFFPVEELFTEHPSPDPSDFQLQWSD